MPCQEPVKPTTSNLAVESFASLSAASFASPPVLRKSDFERPGGSIWAMRWDSATTGGLSMPLKRWSAPSHASRIASTMRGWLWPRVAHIWPEVKSRISRPSVSQIRMPRALAMRRGTKGMP
jgi:hypothetical protein